MFGLKDEVENFLLEIIFNQEGIFLSLTCPRCGSTNTLKIEEEEQIFEIMMSWIKSREIFMKEMIDDEFFRQPRKI